MTAGAAGSAEVPGAVAGLQLLTFALAFLLPRRAAPAVQGHPASSHDGKAGT